MTKKIIWLLATLLAGLALPSAAQPETPTVHSVDFPKTDAVWTVTFEFRDKPAPAAADKISRQPRRIEIRKEGNLRRDLILWLDGKISERWWLQEPPVVLEEDTLGKIGVSKKGNYAHRLYDNSMFHWVSESTFKTITELGGQPCCYYEEEFILPNTVKAVRAAWIHRETRRPLGYSDSGVISMFSFDPPKPAEPLKLPQKYHARLKQILAFMGSKKK